ncbi:MAG: thioredoxin protein [Chitinophagaceae bacterium]|nr:thioredoxin protein [Chitinophagaceae bacterium]
MKFTNRLAKETSPYLLQHAHNPVDWYSWGDEALNKAVAEHKPILVSIGYAACHWCHVMERESFEDEATAAVMNQHFINIKIDREERPDLDHIYMDAVQAMSGSGGWPLNVFLTPEKKPFYGGTYFPPKRAFNRMSWTEVLLAVNDAWQNRQKEVTDQAEALTAHINQSNGVFFQPVKQEIKMEDLDMISEKMLASADKQWGGFGNAPKFPQTFSIQFLLRHAYYAKNEEAKKQALLSLDKMISGGIYDQLGGGFARYSTDEKWLAPHFEKMLYDNALLISVMAEAFQLTGKKHYADCIKETVSFLQTEMRDNDGAFYSAYDADSEGVEGKYYTWAKQEIMELLGKDADIFCRTFDITDKGNWEHTNILWMPLDRAGIAKENNLTPESFDETIGRCKELLLKARTKRVKPGLDDKILLGWNALLVTALSKAAGALSDTSMMQTAARTIEFIEKNFFQKDQWFHSVQKGQPKQPAFLDDLAYLVQAYIALQEISGDHELLVKAEALTKIINENYADENEAYFYYTRRDQTDVIARKKELHDGAIPSPNGVMAFNLAYLSIVFDKSEWMERSVQMVANLRSAITKYPASFGYWASLYQSLIMGIREIAVVGKTAIQLNEEINRLYIPDRVLMFSETENDTFTLLKDKFQAHQTLIYLCKLYSCKQPVDSITKLVELLQN